MDAYILQVIVECLTCYEYLWCLPNIAAASLNEPLLTLLRYLSEVFALLIRLQPLFPTARLIYLLPEHLAHVAELWDTTCLVLLLLLCFELSECIVLIHRELRTDVRSTHTRGRIVLWVIHIVAIVTLDVATVRTNLSRQVASYLSVEEGSVEVCTHFTYDKAWPYVLKTYVLQTLFQIRKEGVECSRISQTTVYFLSTYLIGDRSDTVCLTEVLSVENQFYSTLSYYVNINDLTLWQEDIYGWIYVNQVVTSQDSCLITIFYTLHSALGIPTLLCLFVLEPWTSVVDCYNVWTSVMHSSCFTSQYLGKLRRSHTCVTTIGIHLIEGGSEVDRRVVALSSAERRFDY